MDLDNAGQVTFVALDQDQRPVVLFEEDPHPGDAQLTGGGGAQIDAGLADAGPEVLRREGSAVHDLVAAGVLGCLENAVRHGNTLGGGWSGRAEICAQRCIVRPEHPAGQDELAPGRTNGFRERHGRLNNGEGDPLRRPSAHGEVELFRRRLDEQPARLDGDGQLLRCRDSLGGEDPQREREGAFLRRNTNYPAVLLEFEAGRQAAAGYPVAVSCTGDRLQPVIVVDADFAAGQGTVDGVGDRNGLSDPERRRDRVCSLNGPAGDRVVTTGTIGVRCRETMDQVTWCCGSSIERTARLLR